MAQDCENHKVRIEHLEDWVKEMSDDIKAIKERLLGRPTWIIVFLLTFLSSVAVGALTFALNVMKG